MSSQSEPDGTPSSGKPLIVLCDGTWCGRETNTKSNIYMLARMVGIQINDPTDTGEHELQGKAWYKHGVGLGSTFLEYVSKAQRHSKVVRRGM